MRNQTIEIVTSIAYLIGVPDFFLERDYSEKSELLSELRGNKSATIIRYLCKLRTALMMNFKKTDEAICYDLKNINSLEWFNQDDIAQLENWNIPVLQFNCRAETYMEHISKLINENIDDCECLFYDWVNWAYIRDLFIFENYSDVAFKKKEFSKFMGNRPLYPYKCYIKWNPDEYGNIIHNDLKFLKIIYEQHDDIFDNYDNCLDASDDTFISIYDFIMESEKVEIVIDCENSNVFKFYSVLSNLNEQEIDKIDKIVLYDDENTIDIWNLLNKRTLIPIERHLIKRVVSRKSLVDVTMTAGICKDFYENQISSFILVTSDSDFWGAINALPDAQFFVMGEINKIGSNFNDKLDEHNIAYCNIDEFCTAKTEEIKRSVLFSHLEEIFPYLYGTSPTDITEKLYRELHIPATSKEKEIFCNKYVKTIKLKIINNKFCYEIQK